MRLIHRYKIVLLVCFGSHCDFLTTLNIVPQMRQQTSTDSKVSQMFDLTFKHSSGDKEKRRQAATNLLVLAQEEAGAERMYQSGGVDYLMRMVDTEGERELRLIGIRVLACMARNSKTRVMSLSFLFVWNEFIIFGLCT